MNIKNILTLDSDIYNGCKNDVEKIELLADYLLNHTILYINKSGYRMCEIEFYLKSDGHIDPFIHGDPHQKTICKWYFHRQFGGGYKSGTYKGLDITFGYSPKTKQKVQVYGGILIRSIKSLDDDLVVEGPCKCVNLILDKTKYDSIGDFVTSNLNDDQVLSANNTDPLYLQYSDKLNRDDHQDVYSCPRVGLTLRKMTDARNRYIMRDYRFIIYPNKIKNFKSGIVLSMYNQGKTIDQISKLTKTRANNIKNYIESYNQGKNVSFDFFNKKKRLSVKDLSMLQGLCHYSFD